MIIGVHTYNMHVLSYNSCTFYIRWTKICDMTEIKIDSPSCMTYSYQKLMTALPTNPKLVLLTSLIILTVDAISSGTSLVLLMFAIMLHTLYEHACHFNCNLCLNVRKDQIVSIPFMHKYSDLPQMN